MFSAARFNRSRMSVMSSSSVCASFPLFVGVAVSTGAGLSGRGLSVGVESLSCIGSRCQQAVFWQSQVNSRGEDVVYLSSVCILLPRHRTPTYLLLLGSFVLLWFRLLRLCLGELSLFTRFSLLFPKLLAVRNSSEEAGSGMS